MRMRCGEEEVEEKEEEKVRPREGIRGKTGRRKWEEEEEEDMARWISHEDEVLENEDEDVVLEDEDYEDTNLGRCRVKRNNYIAICSFKRHSITLRNLIPTGSVTC